MSSFYGNETACRMLASIVERERPGHAYLIYGADGLGKKTFAAHFAKSLLCEGSRKPCFSCPSCIKMQHGTHPDFKVLDETTKSGAIAVDTVRALRLDCAVMPNESTYKIYLIPNIERMTEGAFNAFLKTLEEPPKHVVFLLTAAGTELLAPTILSRVTPIGLFPLPDEIVREVLERDFSATEVSLREQAVALSEGNLGLARGMLSDAGFAEREERVRAFCKAIALRQEYSLLLLLMQFERDKPALQELLSRLLLVVRGALRFRVDGSRTVQLEEQKLAEHLSQKQLLDLLEYLADALNRLSGNENYNLKMFALAAGISSRIG